MLLTSHLYLLEFQLFFKVILKLSPQNILLYKEIMICELILASAMVKMETSVKTKQVINVCYEEVLKQHITFNLFFFPMLIILETLLCM